MKFLKYSLGIALLTVAFTSCVKSRSDQGGLLDDKGSVVIAIAEQQYISVDAQNLQAGYTNSNASFNFTTRPNEAVQMFTVAVSQPRETKISGNLVIKVKMTDLIGNLPAGAINVTDVVIPASTAAGFSVPVLYTVNKTGLNPTDFYAVEFELTSANQGVLAANEKVIDVVFNSTIIPEVGTVIGSTNAFNNKSDYEADYVYTADVVDPVNQFGVHQRNGQRFLLQSSATTLDYADTYIFNVAGSLNKNLVVNNYATGATTSLFQPRYVLNSSNQVVSITNVAGASVTNIQMDPTGENKFVYTANNQRTLRVKYTFTLTTTISGVVTPRTVRVNEEFTFNPRQMYF